MSNFTFLTLIQSLMFIAGEELSFQSLPNPFWVLGTLSKEQAFESDLSFVTILKQCNGMQTTL